MKRVLLLIMAAAVSVYGLGVADALVIPFITDYGHDSLDYGEELQPASPTPNHIMRIVHPSEIREPTLAQINKFIDTSTYGSRAVAAESAQQSAEDSTAKALTYTELNLLLAMWHLANERNSYKLNPLGGADVLREISANAVTPKSH